MKAIVYTKEGSCMFCSKAKLHLKSKGIPFEERKIEVDNPESVEKAARELGQSTIRTVPQIMIDNQYIGGYMDLERWFSEKEI